MQEGSDKEKQASVSNFRLCRQYLIRKKKSFREVFEAKSAVSDKEKQASVKFFETMQAVSDKKKQASVKLFEAMVAGSEKENKLP